MVGARPHRAVVIACTAVKLDHRAAAGRLYAGVTWSTWRKHGPPDLAVPLGWSLWALSAEHGLVEAWRSIDPYDRRMTEERAIELAEHLDWRRKFNDDLTVAERARRGGAILDDVEVVVVGGALYQRCAELAGMPVVRAIDGRTSDGRRGGIGVLRQRLAWWAAEVTSSGDADPWADKAWPTPEQAEDPAAPNRFRASNFLDVPDDPCT